MESAKWKTEEGEEDVGEGEGDGAGGGAPPGATLLSSSSLFAVVLVPFPLNSPSPLSPFAVPLTMLISRGQEEEGKEKGKLMSDEREFTSAQMKKSKQSGKN